MASRKTTFEDLDALLRRLGFASRRVRLSRPGASENGRGRVSVPARLYSHAATGIDILLPDRPFAEEAGPQHLIPLRRQLTERGLIEVDAFERWLGGGRPVCGEREAGHIAASAG